MTGDRRRRLKAEDVLDLRRLYAEGGMSMLKLAHRFKVAKSTVQDVIEERTWRHLLPSKPARAPRSKSQGARHRIRAAGYFQIRED